MMRWGSGPEAGDRPELGLPQRAQRLLGGVGLGEICGRDRLGQVLVAGPCAVGFVKEAGGFGGGEHGLIPWLRVSEGPQGFR